jgi:membrane dipeptidase
MLIVDAHEDIAYNALTFGRDVRRSAHQTRGLEVHSDAPRVCGPAMLGLPDWLAGGVAVVFGTLFIAPERKRQGLWDLQTYRTPQEAHHRASAQLDYYHRLADDTPAIRLVRSRSELEAGLATWGESAEPQKRQVGIVVLMEGADAILEPKEAESWFERGVRIFGLSWAGTHYAGGTGEPGPLTSEGRELLDVLADLGAILDLSHASEKAFFEELDRFEGTVITSHANPQAFVPGDRQLSDAQIVRLAERDGVIGIVPFNRMLKAGWRKGDNRAEVTVRDVAAAMDYICQRVGDARHVGIGSDFDGGFGADQTPIEIDTVADLVKIAPALGEMGYSEQDIAAIMGENWLRVLRAGLP